MKFQMSGIRERYTAEVRLRQAGCLDRSAAGPREPVGPAVLVVPVQRGSHDVVRRIVYGVDPEARRIG